MTANAFFLGLDLGQPSESSALAILERQGPSEPEAVFHCRHLQRWPLRTPYSSIVTDVGRMVGSEELQAAHAAHSRVQHRGTAQALQAAETRARPLLALDVTSVGAPVAALFKAAGMPATLRPVELSAGSAVTYEAGVMRIPKRDLVSVAQLALQEGRLKVSPKLPEAETLTRELQGFRVKVTLAEGEQGGAWREGSDDDLVFAVALALYVSRQPPAVQLPGSYSRSLFGGSYSGVPQNFNG